MDYRYKAVFSNQIWDWFIHDIQSCFKSSISAQSSNGGKGGQNFPAALVILVVIEFCAGFYVGKEQATTEDVVKFMVKYLGKHDSRFASKTFAKKFFVVFRHGLAHVWSPKGSGIAMDFRNNEIMHKNGTVPILNVPPFFQLVCAALHDYESDLGTDTKLNSNFAKRLDTIYKKDASAANALIKLY